MKKIIVFFVLVLMLLYSYKDKQVINNKKESIKQDINIKDNNVQKKDKIIKLSYNNV